LNIKNLDNRELNILYKASTEINHKTPLKTFFSKTFLYFSEILSIPVAFISYNNVKNSHILQRSLFNKDIEKLFLNYLNSRFDNTPLPDKIFLETTTIDNTEFNFLFIANTIDYMGCICFKTKDTINVEFSPASGVVKLAELLLEKYTSIINQMILDQKLKELSSLYEVGKTISTSLNLVETLDKVIFQAQTVMDCEASSVFLIDEETNELYFFVTQGEKGEQIKEIRLKMGEGIAGQCALTNKPILVPDTSKDERFCKRVDDESKFVTRNLIACPLRFKGKVIGVLEVLNKKGDLSFNEHDVELLEAVGNLAVNAIENARLYENISKLYLSTVKVLSAAMDAKDQYTHGHSERVALYSTSIAKKLGFSEKHIESLNFAALLHDIGKIGVRDAILCKPGKLTDEEYAIMKMHPVRSADILQKIDFFKNILPWVKHHHERYDGRGYPDGLKEEEIPLEARIIAVADAFDAMTSHRAYRKGLPLEVALQEIERCSGSQFDPKIAKAFIEVFHEELEEVIETLTTRFQEQEKIKE